MPWKHVPWPLPQHYEVPAVTRFSSFWRNLRYIFNCSCILDTHQTKPKSNMSQTLTSNKDRSPADNKHDAQRERTTNKHDIQIEVMLNKHDTKIGGTSNKTEIHTEATLNKHATQTEVMPYKHDIQTEGMPNKHGIQTEGMSNKHDIQTEVMPNKHDIQTEVMPKKHGSQTQGTSNVDGTQTEGTSNKRDIQTEGTSNRGGTQTEGTLNKNVTQTEGTSNKVDTQTETMSNKHDIQREGTPNKGGTQTEGTSNKHDTQTEGTPNKHATQTEETSSKHSTQTGEMWNKYGTQTERTSNKHGTQTEGMSGNHDIQTGGMSRTHVNQTEGTLNKNDTRMKETNKNDTQTERMANKHDAQTERTSIKHHTQICNSSCKFVTQINRKPPKLCPQRVCEVMNISEQTDKPPSPKTNSKLVKTDSTTWSTVFRNLISPVGLWNITWLAVIQFHLFFFLGIFNSLTEKLGGTKQSVQYYASLVSLMQFSSLLFQPLIGVALDVRQKRVTNLYAPTSFAVTQKIYSVHALGSSLPLLYSTSVLSFLLAVCTSVKILEMQFVSCVLFTVCRAFLYSGSTLVIANAFRSEHFGKVFSGTGLIAAIPLACQNFLFRFIEDMPKRNDLYVNIALAGLAILTLGHPIRLHLRYRRDIKDISRYMWSDSVVTKSYTPLDKMESTSFTDLKGRSSVMSVVNAATEKQREVNLRVK